jgi:Ca2+-binding EF-hand superfamily protein
MPAQPAMVAARRAGSRRSAPRLVCAPDDPAAGPGFFTSFYQDLPAASLHPAERRPMSCIVTRGNPSHRAQGDIEMSCTISSANPAGMAGMQTHFPGGGARRMAENLFSELDASNQGYVTKSDLLTAVGQASGAETATDIDSLFSALDADQDGQVTKSEFGDAVAKLSQQLDGYADGMRMLGAMGAGGMPPPPPQDGSDDAGLSKDALSQILQSGSAADNKRSSVLSSILDNFDAIDTDGNGKVTHREAHAFRAQRMESSGVSAADSTQSSPRQTVSTQDRFALQLHRLLAAYGAQAQAPGSTAVSATA